MVAVIAALFNPVTILLATICIQWVVLAEVGNYSLHVPYLALGTVVLYAFTSRNRLAASLLYVRRNAIWTSALVIYFIILAAVLSGSAGENMPPRQLFYLVCGIAFAACIATAQNLSMIFRIGSGLGLLLFVIFVEILARSIGLSWIDAITRFLQSGNLQFVIYSFFRAVFNSIDPTRDVAFSSSTKNTIASCVLVLGLLFRSGSANPQRDVIGMAVIGVALGLLVLLNTRSVLITAGGSLFLATAIGAMTRNAQNTVLLILKLLGLLALVVVAVQLSAGDSAVSATLGDRFAFDDYSSAARMDQYRTALDRIQQHPFRGSGYFEVGGLPIHNIFLSSWMYAGLVAFLLVVVFYVTVLVRWLVFLVTVVTTPGRWVLPLAVEWVAPLPLLPLFRVWLSGDSGHFAIGEWIAISAFFGCCLANELRYRALLEFDAREPWNTRTMSQGPVVTGFGGASAPSILGRQ